MPRSSANAAAPARSVSSSRQFVVYGPDAQLRGAVCYLAEQTKKIALSLLREEDHWKTPIVIDAQSPEANLPELPPAPELPLAKSPGEVGRPRFTRFRTVLEPEL